MQYTVNIIIENISVTFCYGWILELDTQTQDLICDLNMSSFIVHQALSPVNSPPQYSFQPWCASVPSAASGYAYAFTSPQTELAEVITQDGNYKEKDLLLSIVYCQTVRDLQSPSATA